MEELPDALSRCTQLRKLLVSKNRLKRFPSCYTRMVSLSVLQADGNELLKVGMDVDRLSSLTQLRLSHNRLTSEGLPYLMGNAPSLTELGLSNNRLEMLPPSLGATPLVKLTLEGNLLLRPPQHLVFKGLDKVQAYLAALQFATSSASLDLSRNALADCPLPLGPGALPAETTLWRSLTFLSLEGNKLAGVPTEIAMLTSIQVLDLQYNRLAVLPGSLGALTALLVLDVASNSLQTLPEELAVCTLLQELLLENNRFSEVPRVIGEVLRLRELRMTSNRIQALPNFLASLNSLTHLDVDHNRLSGGTPTCLTGLHSLRMLKLSHNGLSDFAGELTKLRYASDSLQPASLFARKPSELQLRRQQIRLLLGGGERTSYRARERLPVADATCGSRPPGAGDRRGWALVRFAIFGEQGQKVDENDPASPLSSSSSSSEEEEEEELARGASSIVHEQGKRLAQARKGLVKGLRARIFATRLPGSTRTVASLLGLDADDETDAPTQPAPAQGTGNGASDAPAAATASAAGAGDTVLAQEQEDREFQELVARSKLQAPRPVGRFRKMLRSVQSALTGLSIHVQNLVMGKECQSPSCSAGQPAGTAGGRQLQ